MFEIDPPIIDSPHSQTFIQDGVTLRVVIFKLEEDEGWTLEVVNEAGTSTVWEEPFDSDMTALNAFKRAVEQEGIEAFLDDDNGGWATIH
ncbi:hypothetical protein EDF58_1103 [Novosphingobium sp. PhB57]|uniref:hypothetical protein n=1 Tax=Novosphingobium sp. PhB57 TaxID=2485107 RepID=UPI001048183B|nr:hypothetical protein [Novosphingobium sp. PhB57]TCU53753.1 hypothetical protein EDF58_1103 [Novosphingobium sp. PhB57]